MHKIIDQAHKHILIASICTLALAFGSRLLEGYMSPQTTSASGNQLDVSLSIIPYPSVVASGDAVGLLLYYKTKGQGDATDVQLTATLPAGMQLQSAVPAVHSQQGNQLTWTNLPDNYGPVVLEVIATGPENTQLPVQASVSTSSPESNLNNNNAAASIMLSNMSTSPYVSDIQVSLDTSTNIVPGQQKNYTISYQNVGPDMAPEVLIIMTIPNDLTYVTGTRALYPAGSNANTLVWKVFNLPAGSGGTMQTTMLASTLLDAGDSVFTYVTATSINNDPSLLNNQASNLVTVAAAVSGTGSQTPPAQNPQQPQAPAADSGAGAGADDAAQPTQEAADPMQSSGSQQEDLPPLSGFLFVVQSLDLTIPLGTTCAGPSELQAAYAFAHGHQITTMPSLAQARMCDGVIRSELAKMMSNYAINVLGKTPDTTRVCSFPDLAGQPQDLQEAAVTACQLGLMGLNADGSVGDVFNPTHTVTRAIFGTAFSRLLYGDIHNGAGSTWYDAHLAALASDGIIKNTTPTLQELRGYIMIMMQRSTQ